LAGLVVCDCCGKKLQGNLVRGRAFYRCKVSSDYPVAVNDHPRTLAVREDRLLLHVDAWLCGLFAPERIEATAAQIVDVDSQGHREDPAITRARATLTECERKLSKHLDGLEAGIPADVIASRIAATQREKDAAQSVLATAPPAPRPLSLDEVVETLTALRDLPELLGRIEQADRAALYQALGLTVRYRRIGSTEEVQLTSTLRSVDLERVAGNSDARNSQVPALQGVDLERVGGPTGNLGPRPVILARPLSRTRQPSRDRRAIIRPANRTSRLSDLEARRDEPATDPASPIRVMLRRKGRYPAIIIDDVGRGMARERLKEVLTRWSRPSGTPNHPRF
jgi:hypothetical protein